jgi:hypothetical protein
MREVCGLITTWEEKKGSNLAQLDRLGPNLNCPFHGVSLGAAID